MKQKDVERLVRLTQMRSDAAQAELAAAVQHMRAIETRIAELRRLDAAQAQTDISRAVDAEIALRWRRWVDGRMIGLNGELAASRAKVLDAKDRTRTAFGRTQAMKRLEENIEQSGQRQKAMRDAWSG